MKIRAHETFCIRNGWLHKGVKNIVNNPRLFTDKDINPCDLLGIGSNMVKSLRYWMTAVGVMYEKQEGSQRFQCLTQLGKLIDKYDRYYEEDGTNWIIHYKLATNIDYATAWYWFFNEFRANIFDKKLFTDELTEYLKTTFNYDSSSKMIEDEFACVLHTYYSKEKEENPENTTGCPLTELHLIDVVKDGSNNDYRKTSPAKQAIHPIIAYAVVMDQYEKDEILISDLSDKKCGLGKVFNLDKDTLFYLIEQLQKMGYISISRTAGLDVIRIKERISFYEAVERYYQTINGAI
jgi:hypothetical protein